MILRCQSSTISSSHRKCSLALIVIIGLILSVFISVTQGQEPQDGLEGAALPQEFSPTVTATCRGNSMTISVKTTAPFYGVVTPKNVPRSNDSKCFALGNGNTQTTLVLNTLADANDPDYCGVTYSERTDERSVQLAVRAHRTLELAEDKIYVVTCGKAGFSNPNGNEQFTVRLGIYANEKSKRSLNEVVHGRSYQLRVELGSSEANQAIRVRSCFGFGNNNSVPLVDDNGCPERGVISRWQYFTNSKIAEATIYGMFRFPDSRRLNIQCDVLICQESSCPNPTCESLPASLIAGPIPQRQKSPNESSVLASTTVTVLEPGEKPLVEELRDGDDEDSVECTGLCRYWNLLFWLAIIFGILCLIMLLVSCFLCSALTCTCTRTELVEKEPSVLEDYDPYRSSWAGSNYGGSRYSLTNGHHHSTANKPIYSVSAESNGSDHYATVPSRHSRPGSRYSNGGVNGNLAAGSPYTQNRKL